MKKYIITSLLIGILLMLLLSSVPLIGSLFIELGNNTSEKDPKQAEKYYEIAKIFAFGRHEKNTIIYNEARLAYKDKKYIPSILSFKNNIEPKISFESKHNLGNSFYRLGQMVQDPSQTIQSWENALTAYSGALKLKKDPETKANYDFVLKKLQEFQKQQKSQDKDAKTGEKSNTGSGNTKQESGSGSENKKDDSKEKKGETSSGSEDPQKDGKKGENGESRGGNTQPGVWKNNGEFNNVGSGAKRQDTLTPEQKKEIEQYLQGLKQGETDSRKYFQNDPSQMSSNGVSDMIQNFFGDDSYFHDDLNGNTKKDW